MDDEEQLADVTERVDLEVLAKELVKAAKDHSEGKGISHTFGVKPEFGQPCSSEPGCHEPGAPAQPDCHQPESTWLGSGHLSEPVPMHEALSRGVARQT